MLRRALARLAGSVGLVALGACSSDAGSAQTDDLTAIRAQSRELTFEGRVYVAPGSSDASILAKVHAQTQSMFGALRTVDIGVNKRELKGVDPATFVKRDVLVVDTDAEGDAGEPMLEVRYTYVDKAVVPKRMAAESTLPSALLRPDYASERERVLEECTPNDEHSRDFASSLWYVFEPRLASCRDAIHAEQELVDAARAKLEDPEAQVARADARRLYLPVTVALGPDETNQGPSYPEYDRLYAGGVREGKLVISLINGLIDHGDGAIFEDTGYSEWLATLKQVLAENPDFEVVEVEGGEDLFTYTLESGREVTGLTFLDFIQFDTGYGFPYGLEPAERADLRRQVGERITDKWITFEAPRTVKLGDGEPRDLGIQITTFMGHAESTAPFKHAIKNSDVFLYNGHSMIGRGPLDPRNFTEADFPASYQILFVDGCVSYNYYEADYVPLKQGGTKNLDLITNAIESPAYRSGYALGRFIDTLIDGRAASYTELLKSAEATGSGLRVVNGELDNEYTPDETPIELSVRE